MSVDQIISLLATVTLFEMMVSIGLGVSTPQVLEVMRDRRLLVRAAVANYVLVPLIAVGLLWLFQARPLVAAGILIAAVCPGAPYGPPFTSLARGKVQTAVGLMIVLAGSSAILAPVLLRILLPLVAGNERVQIDVGKIIGTLLFSQLLPLSLGLLVRARRPAWAQRLIGPAGKLSLMLNLSLLTLILAVHFRLLLAISPTGYLGMTLLIAGCVLAGGLTARSSRDERKTLSIVTAVRNAGVSLVIAAGSLPGTPAVTTVTAYGLFQTVVMALVAWRWGRAGSKPDAR